MKAHLTLFAAALALLASPRLIDAQQYYGRPQAGMMIPAGYSMGYGAPGVPGAMAAPSQPMAYPAMQQPVPDDCGSCATCGDCESVLCCADGCHTPTWYAYADYLYLRPSDEKVSYAVPFNGDVTQTPQIVQIGEEAVVDPSFDTGLRVGFGHCVSDCATLGGVYTWFESSDEDSITLEAPLLRSLVQHPGTAAAPSNFLAAAADYDIEFQLADIEYRNTFWCGELFAARYVVAARYAHLEERFDSVFVVGANAEAVNTEVTFDGAGIRLGLEGERYACNSGLMVYSRANASFLTGQFDTDYSQQNTQFGLLVDTGWKEDRVVSILDLEVGGGWRSQNDVLRVTAGYMFSAWYNVISTEELINAVQSADSTNADDTLTFSGLVVRSEVRF